MLLLCALIVGSSSLWGDNVNVISEDFSSNNTKAKLETAGWTISNTTSHGTGYMQIASGSGAGSATTPAFSSLVGTKATLSVTHISSGNASRTLTITGVNCKVDGKSSTTVTVNSSGSGANTSTIAITEAGTNSKVTFSAAKSAGTKLNSVVVYYTAASSSPLHHINLSGSYPTEFTVGDAFSHTGMVVTATYEDSNTSNVTADASWTGYDMSSTGVQNVTVSYTESNVTKTATYSITVKAAANLSFSPSSKTVALYGKETISFSKSTDAAVDFVVEDETIATYNSSTGEVEGLKVGTTTITATSDATSSYSAGEAVCTITVADPDWIDLTMQGYDNAEDVTTVNSDNGSLTFDVGTNAQGNGPKWYDSGSAVRLYSGNTITIAAPVGYVILSLEFSVTSGKMSISDFSATVTGSDNKFTLSTPANSITYATSSNFRIDKVKINLPSIRTEKICTDGTKYYATFSYAQAFVVPSNLTISEASVANGHLNLSKYTTGETVPANTGVLVSSATPGNYKIALTTGGTSKLSSGNLLHPGGVDAAAMATAAPSCKYYKLALEKDGESYVANTAGFYYGAAEGAAFASSANKAYLAVPIVTGAPSHFLFTEEENNATNIESIEAVEEGVKFVQNGQLFIKKNGVVYDMLGTVVR